MLNVLSRLYCRSSGLTAQLVHSFILSKDLKICMSFCCLDTDVWCRGSMQDSRRLDEWCRHGPSSTENVSFHPELLLTVLESAIFFNQLHLNLKLKLKLYFLCHVMLFYIVAGVF